MGDLVAGIQAKRKAFHREVEAERSVERIRGRTYRNRIGGVRGRASVNWWPKARYRCPSTVMKNSLRTISMCGT